MKLVSEYAESIGVTVKPRYVVPLRRRKPLARCRSHVILQAPALSLGKETGYSFLAGMAERRIAQIVRQACGRHDSPQRRGKARVEFGVTLHEHLPRVDTQRTPHARHLKAVCKAVVHKHTPRQGEHLRLVLHAAERGRENQAVVIALKLRPVLLYRIVAFLEAVAFVGDKSVPVHQVHGSTFFVVPAPAVPGRYDCGAETCFLYHKIKPKITTAQAIASKAGAPAAGTGKLSGRPGTRRVCSRKVRNLSAKYGIFGREK